MRTISDFHSSVYSEELFPVNEQEHDEVMRLMAEGYDEWSKELEQGQIVNTPHGEILINKECSHTSCRTTRCERDVRIGGIAI